MCSKYPQVIILMKNAVIELCDLNVWDAFGIVSEQDASDCKETTTVDATNTFARVSLSYPAFVFCARKAYKLRPPSFNEVH